MFNIGGSELLVILFVALIFLGPERLPTAAKQVGKTIATLRGMAQGFQREFEDAITIAEDSAREEEARARGAELVAASNAAADSGDATATTEDGDAGDGTEIDDGAIGAATPVGFDPTAGAEPDRTEKAVSSDGPMFHSAGPGVGPTIARRTPNGESAAANGDAEPAATETAATPASADVAAESASDVLPLPGPAGAGTPTDDVVITES